MRRLSLVSVLALGLAGVSHASNPLGDASSFNAFIFGNYAAASDSDGPIAAGGALTGSQNINMDNYKGTIGTTTGIDVYGGLSSSLGGNLDGSGGNVYLQSGTFSANNNASAAVHIGTNSTLANAFSADESYLKSVSAQLAGFTTGNGKAYDFDVNYTNQNGNDALFLYGNGQSLSLGTHNNLSFNFADLSANFVQKGVSYYVLDISATELSLLNSNAGNITWEGLDATHNLILNINGGGNSVLWHPQQQTNSDDQYTLYNFVNTPTVDTDQIFTGSILAVNASLVQGNGDIQGNIVANSFTQDAEIHFGGDGNGNFNGSLPTPEPAPFAALGLGALAFLRKRKKA